MDDQGYGPTTDPSFRIDDPTGAPMRIPANSSEDRAYFTPGQPEQIRRYYDKNGYVVIRGLVPRALCEAARVQFLKEVKPFGGFIYRQTTANPERHVVTDHGHVLNPILNVQSLDHRRFPEFRGAGLAILTHARVQAAVRAPLDEPGKIVQSMYFDGNPVTWAHQDTYYLDAEKILPRRRKNRHDDCRLVRGRKYRARCRAVLRLSEEPPDRPSEKWRQF